MEPRPKPKWPILLAVLVAVSVVVLSAIYGPGARKSGGLDPQAVPEGAAPVAPQATGSAPAAEDSPVVPTAAAEPPSTAGTAETVAATSGPLQARVPQDTGLSMQPFKAMGSLDPERDAFQLEFASRAAGVDRIVFGDYWFTAVDRELARAHRSAVRKGAAAPPPMPPDSAHYELKTLGTLQGYEVPLLAARFVEINGQLVSVFGPVWGASGPGDFQTEIVDASGQVVARVRRTFVDPEPGKPGFDMRLQQRVQNAQSAPLRVRWIQYGPGDLTVDAGGMMDIRRFQFGYLYGAQRDPQRQNVIVHGAMFDRADVIKRVEAGNAILWPQEEQRQQAFELAWFGTTNRYFALAVHADWAPQPGGSKVLGAVQEVWGTVGESAPDKQVAFSELRSPVVTVEPGATAAFDMGVFAGPLDPRLLEGQEPFQSLRMDGLILYLISGCCSFCTFAWLANAIVVLLTLLHDHVVFDWSLSIIVLVILVRLALHPITRYSQIQMARVTRGMAAIKPELEALQKRYATDPKRLQQEQLRLYREKGVNPVGCVGGMLPMFLQMPIWIALYAVLYFAFELRQTPAFFGVFQRLGEWQFLGDLSAPDRFITFSKPLITWPFEFSAINVIPLLMAVVFFLQQKYMAPPTMGTLTPEQEQQQKMMKWMTVIMFPIMLYMAPSGLTLYILTSTCIGIVESKRVRRQIEKMDFTPRPRQPGKQDRLGKLYEAAMQRAQEKREQRGRRFKERD